MKRIEFDFIYELADKLLDYFDTDNSKISAVAVYAKYNIIKELFETLVMSGCPIYGTIDLEDYETDHYSKEFILYLEDEGVSIERAYYKENEFDDEGYCYSGTDINFVHEDCSSKILPYIDGTKIEFGFAEEYDKNDKKSSDEDYNENDDMHGFTVSKTEDNKYRSLSFYSTDKISEKEIKNILQEFGF